MSKDSLITAIDAVLPQTQCGLCGYGGCRPYAQALATNSAEINGCPPGGVKTLQAIGALLDQDPSPYEEELRQKAKPPSIAIIREAECIGCTKCIQACPVDAILGSSKRMHTIITSDCTGCELCVEPCPVDCIDIIKLSPLDDAKQQEKANYWRELHNKKQQRLIDKQSSTQKIEAAEETKEQRTACRKKAIQEALGRAKAKKEQEK